MAVKNSGMDSWERGYAAGWNARRVLAEQDIAELQQEVARLQSLLSAHVAPNYIYHVTPEELNDYPE